MKHPTHQLHARIPEALWNQLFTQAQHDQTTVTELLIQFARMGLALKQNAQAGGKLTIVQGESTKELVFP